MATEGSSINSAIIGGNTWQVIFSWKRTSYDIASNISLIDWTLSIYRSNPVAVSGTYVYEYGSHATVDGEQVHSNSSTIKRVTNADSMVIASGSKTITHNTDGTKTFDVSYDVSLTSSSNTISETASFTLDTIPRYATSDQSLSSRTLNTITMSWSSDSTIDYIWYSKDGGSNWIDVGSVNGTSGSYIISGLSPNTSYSIKTKVRRKDSQLATESSALAVTTYQMRINFKHCKF